MDNKPPTSRRTVLFITLVIFVLLVIGGYFIFTSRTSLIKVSPTINPTIIAIPDLILYFSFSGNANDISGNGNDGKVTGAKLTTDRFGRKNSAYYFDGIDDSITFDASRMPVRAFPRTISAWIKADSYPPAPENFQALGSRATVIGWGKDNDRQLSEMQIYEGKLLFHVYNADTYGNQPIELNKWYHVVIIYTDQKTVLYTNGIKEEFPSALLDTINGVGRVGAFSDPTVKSPLFPNGYDLSYFHGVIDDIRIYKQALTYENVMLLYFEEGWK